MTARLREAVAWVVEQNDEACVEGLAELAAAFAEDDEQEASRWLAEHPGSAHADAPRGPLTTDEIRDLFANPTAWEGMVAVVIEAAYSTAAGVAAAHGVVWDDHDHRRMRKDMAPIVRTRVGEVAARLADERARNLMAALSAYHAEVEALVARFEAVAMWAPRTAGTAAADDELLARVRGQR